MIIFLQLFTYIDLYIYICKDVIANVLRAFLPIKASGQSIYLLFYYEFHLLIDLNFFKCRNL